MVLNGAYVGGNVLGFEGGILFTPSLNKAPANPSDEIYLKDSLRGCSCCSKAGYKIPPKLNKCSAELM